MEFDKQTQTLLCKEAALSSMNLGVGLTFLRKYNFAELGFIYQAFLSLSIGIERIIKLMLLYEHIYHHNSFPPKNFLKSKGHDIELLFQEALKLGQKYKATKYFENLNKTQIPSLIIKNLSDFAKQNRYFQLDKLSGMENSEDPVARWDKEINSLIVEKHFNPNTRNNRVIIAMSGFMDEFSSFRHYDEQGQDIANAKDFIQSSISSMTKQKYGMYYAFCVVKALCELQQNQNSELHSNAFLYEFFTIFRTEYQDAKTKKSWNPYSPYYF